MQNGEKTKQLGIRTVIFVGGFASVVFIVALFQGSVTVPENIQTVVTAGMVSLLGGLFIAANTYMQARTARISREEAAREATLIREENAREAIRIREEAIRQAEISRQRSDDNARETRKKVQEGIDVMHNGLAAETAAIVKEDSDKRAEDLRIALAADAARMEIAALTAKVDAFMQRQAAPVAPHLVLPNGQTPDPALQTAVDAIENHTAQTAANTAGRDEPGGAAV